MAHVGLRELLEAGVHFGHQTRRWNPKMRRFIHGDRGGIYLIDLLKTEALLAAAQEFTAEIALRGGTVLFVGTKKQARDAIKECAEAAGMPYVNHRWLGGLLTNFQTINKRIARLHDLERYEAEGQLALLPTRERMAALADLTKLRANLGGVKHMTKVPDVVF
ncbi:MAG: 30S ribosomal protein S2, partial [Solirubrobacterales bacterium]|nr:30S ribosomal protein S2 [Solirubrobacterales bacterium]